MKRIVASVGMVAVGASGLQAALLPSSSTESGKPWTVSATLRGFYDDNINTIPDNATLPAGYSRGSTGFEISPSIQFSFPMEQTSLSFGYVYSLKYYDNQPYGEVDHYDQTHEFDAALTHAFSERYQVAARDSFVIGQEPDILRAGNTFTTFQRISGDNIRNYGTITLAAQLTPEFSVELGYANTLYSYADSVPTGSTLATFYPSYTGLLDELDHVVHLDGRYQFAPQTTAVLGYQFRETDYTGDQPIAYYIAPSPLRLVTLMSDERDARSHYVYAGLDHNFRPDLTGSFRAGARYTDYYNTAGQSDVGPYAMASLRYTYLPDSYVEAGFSYDYSASDVWEPDSNGNLTLNAESASLYVSVNHRITPKLYGSLLAQFQNSTFYGGLYDGKAEKYYLVGLNLQYRFTPNFSAEVGYNYDYVDSELPGRGYNRNRVYVGVTGSY